MSTEQPKDAAESKPAEEAEKKTGDAEALTDEELGTVAGGYLTKMAEINAIRRDLGKEDSTS